MNLLYDASASFNDFLKGNAWWIALILAALILVIVLALILPKQFKKKGKSAVSHKVVVCEYDEALGGLDNVISHVRKGSRIELVLKDYSLLNKDKIKEAGVDSFILMSNKITLVIQGDAEKVEKALFPED